MKKIVFATIPMQEIEGAGWDQDGYVYRFEENKDLECRTKVHIPVNGVLTNLLKKDDDVKVVRIYVDTKNSLRNAEIQKEELECLNKNIGAKLIFEDISTEFDETSSTVEQRFKKLIEKLEDNCEIILDMTYGSKTLVPVLFYVLGFAEKFFNADIKNILYDKARFEKCQVEVDGKMKEVSTPNPESCEIFDITPLFYLNSLTSIMEAPDGKTALARLDKFFAL